MPRTNLVANGLLAVLVIAVPLVIWQKLKSDPAPDDGTAVSATDPQLALIREGKLEEAAQHYLGLLESSDGRSWADATEGLAQLLDALKVRLAAPTTADVELLQRVLLTAWPKDALRTDNAEGAYAALVEQDMDRAVEIGVQIHEYDAGTLLGSVFPSAVPTSATDKMVVESIVYLEIPRGWIDTVRPDFRWYDASREDKDKASYILSLYDAANEKVFEHTVTGQSFTYPEDGPDLIQGMGYRWTIEPAGMIPTGGPFEGEFHPLDGPGRAAVDGLILTYKDRYENELLWRFFLGNMTLERQLYIGAERCFEKLQGLTDAKYPRQQLQVLYGPDHLNLPYRFNELLD